MTGWPAEFGQPPTTSGKVALTVIRVRATIGTSTWTTSLVEHPGVGQFVAHRTELVQG